MSVTAAEKELRSLKDEVVTTKGKLLLALDLLLLIGFDYAELTHLLP